jgi:LacI family transcriptional regulator
MATRIYDIAKQAGVSLSAVSLALNNKPGVSNELRQKIVSIAVETGYKTVSPEHYYANENITIKLLKIAKHGHIVNERHSAFITEYMEGIEIAAQKRKYKLEIAFFDKVPISEIISSQKGSAVDGFLVLGTELNTHELAYFSELTKPVVFLDSYFPLSLYDCVDMDNNDGVFKAIHYLYNCGHRSIGLIKSSYETRNFKLREFGFREALEYFSLPIQDQYMVSVDPAYNQSIADMSKFLQRARTLPSAFFCMNDIIAYGCMKALRDHNLRIPEDVSIIGFDDLPASGISEPPLTTIRVSTRQIGQRALEKVSEQILKRSEYIPENILIAGRLVVRGSVRQL